MKRWTIWAFLTVTMMAVIPKTNWAQMILPGDGVYRALNAPCRLFDTRASQAGILVADVAQGFLAAGQDLRVQGASGLNCGLPNPTTGLMTAMVVNLTATQADGTGFISAAASTGPTVGSGLQTTSILNFSTSTAGGSEALQNLVIIPVCGPIGTTTPCRQVNTFHFDIRASVSSVHLVGDVVGFIAPPPTPMCVTMTSTPFTLNMAFTTGHIFLLNGDIELNRYREPFVQKVLKELQS